MNSILTWTVDTKSKNIIVEQPSDKELNQSTANYYFLSFFTKVIYLVAIALVFSSDLATAQQIIIKPMLHSIGYRVQMPLGYDADSTAFTEVRYRALGQDWQPGFPAARLAIGEFWGSLFQLDAATDYELEVSMVDSFPVFEKIILTAAATTLVVPNVQSLGNLKWVSPNGIGSVYSETSPGNLQTLFASGLPCGTTVLMKGGNYALDNLNLQLNTDCAETEPITIMAAPGESPVFDGGSYEEYTWTQGTGDTSIWWTNLPADLEFNALCLVDGERMYPYAFLTPPIDPTYPSLWTLGFDLPGFYRNKQNQVFIKTIDHKNINDSEVIFSKRFNCLTINGNNKNIHLRIKGIHFKYYGKGLCHKDFLGNPEICFPSNTLHIIDASHVVVDNCTFDFCNFPVTFGGNCNNNIVMNCQIKDGTGYWSHAAFKTSRDFFVWLFDPNFGSYGRYLENAGIHFTPNAGQETHGNIVWKNTVEGVVGGINLGSPNGSVMMDNDVYENKVSWCYDGIDAVGGHRNARIWRNEVGYCPVGTSLISREQKPVYIFRNVYHHLDQRQNYRDDPNFRDCDNTDTHQSWSTALKLNAGSEAFEPTDLIYFIHNTVHSNEPLAFNLYLWEPTWKSLQLRNNIFYGEGESNFMFDGVMNQPTYSFESIGNNVVNAGTNVKGIVRPIHGGLNECFEYENMGDLESGLSGTTGSPFSFFENTLNELPHFVDPENEDFHLLPTSPLINQGLPVPGFNNQFEGIAPDIGAFELPDSIISVQPVILIETGLVIFPNPSTGEFFVRFNSPGGVADLQVWDSQGRLLAEKHFSDLPSGKQTLGINISTFQTGVYFLKIWSAEGLATGRLMKK